MKNSIKTFSAVLVTMFTVLSIAATTAFTFLAILPVTGLAVAALVVPVGAAVTLFAGLMVAVKANDMLD